MSLNLRIFDEAGFKRYVSTRPGETKVGELVHMVTPGTAPSLIEELVRLRSAGVRFAILLIPEDIGPRANLGRGGADLAPEAFLTYFMNMQANQFFDFRKVCLVGSVIADGLVQESRSTDDVERLRELCSALDEIVEPIIFEIVRAGLEPIVIGGGNNNSLPIMRGVVRALSEGREKARNLAVVNCDPHADFRPAEGRHSGNPFSCAHELNLLNRYCVFGLHENYNSADSLERLLAAGFRFLSFEDFAIRHRISFEEALVFAKDYLNKNDDPIGCELDLDSIEDVPTSAMTPIGLSPEEAARFIHEIASLGATRYLHLSEGAPPLAENGARTVGKLLAMLVATYVKARDQHQNS